MASFGRHERTVDVIFASGADAFLDKPRNVEEHGASSIGAARERSNTRPQKS
jgi:hypothetical protein